MVQSLLDAELFDLHANLLRQTPSNSDKLRNRNINVPKRNGEIPVIPADSGWAKLFDLHANLFRQIPGNSDKLRKENINVPKQNGEIPVIPADSGREGKGKIVYETGNKLTI